MEGEVEDAEPDRDRPTARTRLSTMDAKVGEDGSRRDTACCAEPRQEAAFHRDPRGEQRVGIALRQAQQELEGLHEAGDAFEVRHAAAPALARLDQSHDLEAAQGFPHDGAADVEGARQRVLARQEVARPSGSPT